MPIGNQLNDLRLGNN